MTKVLAGFECQNTLYVIKDSMSALIDFIISVDVLLILGVLVLLILKSKLMAIVWYVLGSDILNANYLTFTRINIRLT